MLTVHENPTIAAFVYNVVATEMEWENAEGAEHDFGLEWPVDGDTHLHVSCVSTTSTDSWYRAFEIHSSLDQ